MAINPSSGNAITKLRWIARILGTLLVVGFLFLFLSEVIQKGELKVPGTINRIMFAFFLLGQVGLLLAWRWEGLGGILAAVGMMAAILVSILWEEGKDAHFGFMFWLIPIFLYLYCWRKSEKGIQRAQIE